MQLAAEAPEALKPGDVGVLAEFLASKLTDWCAAAVGKRRAKQLRSFSNSSGGRRCKGCRQLDLYHRAVLAACEP